MKHVLFSTIRLTPDSNSHGFMQLFRILDFRGNETLQDINRAIRSNLEVLQGIASESRQENTNLTNLTLQSQQDSKTLKALNFVVVVYVPASLMAVCKSG